ncbi:MAG: DNA/RNA nuclease SfsA [Deltaproteobacteria bacterium]|jgi:sugar fermentation stimulation protein A|nr:DNA/RNA nuclease SfsA [Deltaproteobacteria bacterium]
MDCWLEGADSSLPNPLAESALIAVRVKGFPAGASADSEVRRGASRLDLRWGRPGRYGPECLVEVKNCAWAEGGRALFPDAAGAGSSKHLAGPEGMARSGMPAALVAAVQRPDGKSFSQTDAADTARGGAGRGGALRSAV